MPLTYYNNSFEHIESVAHWHAKVMFPKLSVLLAADTCCGLVYTELQKIRPSLLQTETNQSKVHLGWSEY